MKKKVCPKCGIENELTRYFCESCGAFLEENEYEIVGLIVPHIRL